MLALPTVWFLYLIVTFLYALEAYQASLVEPWFVRGRAKRPMARPNEPDMLPKRNKKVRFGIYHAQFQPKIQVSGVFCMQNSMKYFLANLGKASFSNAFFL